LFHFYIGVITPSLTNELQLWKITPFTTWFQIPAYFLEKSKKVSNKVEAFDWKPKRNQHFEHSWEKAEIFNDVEVVSEAWLSWNVREGSALGKKRYVGRHSKEQN